jgi:hypothetical protein
MAAEIQVEPVSRVCCRFAEPYLRDRPISVGFSVSATTYHYDQARDTFGLDPRISPPDWVLKTGSITTSGETDSPFAELSTKVVQPIARLGLSYEFTNSETSAVNPATQLFQSVIAQQGNTFVSSVGSGFTTFVPASWLHRLSTVRLIIQTFQPQADPFRSFRIYGWGIGRERQHDPQPSLELRYKQ